MLLPANIQSKTPKKTLLWKLGSFFYSHELFTSPSSDSREDSETWNCIVPQEFHEKEEGSAAATITEILTFNCASQPFTWDEYPVADFKTR